MIILLIISKNDSLEITPAPNLPAVNGTYSAVLVSTNNNITNNYQSGNGAISQVSNNVIASGGGDGQLKMIHQPMSSNREIVSRVIEQQLLFNGPKNGSGCKTGAMPFLSNISSSQSKFDNNNYSSSVSNNNNNNNNNNYAITSDNSSSELKAAKTMLAIASAASGVGTTALSGGPTTGSTGNESNCSTGSTKSHHQSDSGSETASDDEIHQNEQSSTNNKNTSTLKFYPNRSATMMAIESNVEKNDNEDIKPLNLSSTSSNVTNTNSKNIQSPKKSDDDDDDDGERTITRSNQQIIDHYIDKFLSSGQICGSYLL